MTADAVSVNGPAQAGGDTLGGISFYYFGYRQHSQADSPTRSRGQRLCRLPILSKTQGEIESESGTQCLAVQPVWKKRPHV